MTKKLLQNSHWATKKSSTGWLVFHRWESKSKILLQGCFYRVFIHLVPHFHPDLTINHKFGCWWWKLSCKTDDGKKGFKTDLLKHKNFWRIYQKIQNNQTTIGRASFLRTKPWWWGSLYDQQSDQSWAYSGCLVGVSWCQFWAGLRRILVDLRKIKTRRRIKWPSIRQCRLMKRLLKVDKDSEILRQVSYSSSLKDLRTLW